ncbi:MAG: hypothetical protein H6711_05655 [Myxococcales bacterium]|nr:hypothetical protein [Myxococcales bacterium]
MVRNARLVLASLLLAGLAAPALAHADVAPDTASDSDGDSKKDDGCSIAGDVGVGGLVLLALGLGLGRRR